MWQLSEAIDGMAEACRALSVPVIGGNVSLYNESRGRDIDPTPVVATLGLVDDLQRPPPGIRLVDGGHLLLVGAVGRRLRRRLRVTTTSLAGSRWAVDRRGHRGGRLPPLDLELHRRLLSLISALVGGQIGGPVEDSDALVDGIHDVSEGGLGVALAEMAVRSGVGFRVGGVADHAALFGEGPSRVRAVRSRPSLGRGAGPGGAAVGGLVPAGRSRRRPADRGGAARCSGRRRRGRLARRPAACPGGVGAPGEPAVRVPRSPDVVHSTRRA